jgi:hypothetical protein
MNLIAPSTRTQRKKDKHTSLLPATPMTKDRVTGAAPTALSMFCYGRSL